MPQDSIIYSTKFINGATKAEYWLKFIEFKNHVSLIRQSQGGEQRFG